MEMTEERVFLSIRKILGKKPISHVKMKKDFGEFSYINSNSFKKPVPDPEPHVEEKTEELEIKVIGELFKIIFWQNQVIIWL